jgi:hypothetical protein
MVRTALTCNSSVSTAPLMLLRGKLAYANRAMCDTTDKKSLAHPVKVMAHR